MTVIPSVWIYPYPNWSDKTPSVTEMAATSVMWGEFKHNIKRKRQGEAERRRSSEGDGEAAVEPGRTCGARLVQLNAPVGASLGRTSARRGGCFGLPTCHVWATVVPALEEPDGTAAVGRAFVKLFPPQRYDEPFPSAAAFGNVAARYVADALGAHGLVPPVRLLSVDARALRHHLGHLTSGLGVELDAASLAGLREVHGIAQAPAPEHTKRGYVGAREEKDFDWADCRRDPDLALVDFLVGNNDRRANCFVAEGTGKPLGLDTEGCFVDADREPAKFGIPTKRWKGVQLYMLMHMPDAARAGGDGCPAFAQRVVKALGEEDLGAVVERRFWEEHMDCAGGFEGAKERVAGFARVIRRRQRDALDYVLGCTGGTGQALPSAETVAAGKAFAAHVRRVAPGENGPADDAAPRDGGDC